MIDCLIVGDSIAVGTAMVLPECDSISKGGINSAQWNKRYGGSNLKAGAVIISLGSNDHKWVKTKKELEQLRSNVSAGMVFWILPEGNLPAGGVSIQDIRKIVIEVAEQHHDYVVPIMQVSRDGIHPTGKGYKIIADVIKTHN